VIAMPPSTRIAKAEGTRHKAEGTREQRPGRSRNGLQSVLTIVAVMLLAGPAAAQNNAIGVRGFVTFGRISFQANNTFDAVLGAPSGPIFGGGGQVLLPSGIYVEVSASQFKQDGERVFVGPGNEVFRLGIPLTVRITPLEVTGGFRFRNRSRVGILSRIVAYGGAGYSSYRYQETSESADASENVDERFSGFHIVGGAEYQASRWLAIGGEVAWSSVADALGAGGASEAFAEDNLGGTTVRLKLSVGR
jgi:opacity protein-like surface antigen